MKKIYRIFFIVITGLFLATSYRAQGIPINFYNWTSEAANPSYPTHIQPVEVLSQNSAAFGYIELGFPETVYGDYFPYLFAGNLNTLPGAYYEITFTIQNDADFIANASMSFGDFTTNLTSAINVPNYPPNINQPRFNPVNVDVVLQATSDTTLMNFTVNNDLFGVVYVSNVAVTQVPEKQSTAVLLGIGLVSLLIFRSRVRFELQ
jgi:hypothetical protein